MVFIVTLTEEGGTVKNKRTTVIISILTVIVAILWLISSAFKVSQESTITPELEKIITPLDPTLDSRVFERLQQTNVNTP